jgi:hypothetical protein
MRKHQLASEPLGAKRLGDARPVGPAYEEIEILGVAAEARVMLERVGAAHKVRDTGFPQMPHHCAVHISCMEIIWGMQDSFAHACHHAN